MNHVDTLIIGAGPIGLELAVALKRLGHAYVHLESGQIGQTITWYPRQVQFFSAPDRIAIAGVPLHTVDQAKATREQYLAYLRSIVEQFDLQVNTYERVTELSRQAERFIVHSVSARGRHAYRARHVVLAIGDMHVPRRLDIPGEGLPHVSHYFDEPHRYFRRRLLVVGGRNSAVEAAIRCHRGGAAVALCYRRHAFDADAIKYWLMPEIEMLIRTGRIVFHGATVPVAITPTHVTLASVDDAAGAGPVVDVPADFVLLLTGYEMDTALLTCAGVTLEGENRGPHLDTDTMQTNVPGLYVAGTAAAGTQHRFRLFIENCHPHVDRIARALTGRPAPFDTADRTHSGRYGLPES